MRMRRIRCHDVGDTQNFTARGLVDRNGAQWRLESVGLRYGEARETYEVARTDKDDTVDPMHGIPKHAVGRSGNGPRVDIASVRCDQGLRLRCAHRERAPCGV